MHEDIADDLVRSCVRCNPVASANLQRILADDLVRQAADVLLNAESVPGLAEALLALNDLLGIPDAERQAIVQHPSFRFWLQAMRRTSGGRNPPRHAQLAAELPALVWPTLVKCGTLDRPMTVRADLHGGMRCSPLGRYIELGATCADALYKVRPRSSDGGASLIGPDGVTVFVPGEDLCGGADTEAEIDEHGYRVAVAPRTAGNAIEVSARDPWLRVVLTGTMQRQDGTEFFGVSSGLYTDHPPLVGFEAAFQLIRQEWAAGYGDIPFFSRVLVPADFGASLRSAFTVSSRQGAIFIGDGTPDELVEMILHENAHVKLRQIQMLDTLLEDPLDEQVRISVPWRPDPRPMPGIFEGLFVFAHVAEYHKRRAARIGCDVSRMRIGQLTRDLQHAATALAKHAVLTDRGQEFFKALCVWVDDLSAANSTAEIGTLDA
jgi:hypothetical protein